MIQFSQRGRLSLIFPQVTLAIVVFWAITACFPALIENIKATEGFRELLPRIKVLVAKMEEQPVPLLSQDIECVNATTHLDNLELVPRQLTIHNLLNLQPVGCSQGALVNIIVLKHAFGLNQTQTWLLDDASQMDLALNPTEWTLMDNQKRTWMMAVLADSFAKVGGDLFEIAPMRSYWYLQSALRIDTYKDPMIPGLLAHLMISNRSAPGLGNIEIMGYLQQAARFPSYTGSRLQEYVQLIPPILASERIINDDDLSNWIEYLLDSRQSNLANYLVNLEENGGSLHRFEIRNARSSVYFEERGNSQVADTAMESSGNDCVQSSSGSSGPTNLCRIGREPLHLILSNPAYQQAQDLLTKVEWKWETWSGDHGYADAGFVGHFVQYSVRIQGLWWERLPDKIEPRAGIISSPITLGPNSAYLLSFDYRTTGAEGIPNIYLSNNPSISPKNDVFLPRTHGAWTNKTLEISNDSNEPYEVRLILRSVGLGTTWYKNIVLSPQRNAP